MIPPNVTARLAVFLATTVVGSLVPMVVKEKPVLKWSWDKFSPVIMRRVSDRFDRGPAPIVEPDSPPRIVIPDFTPRVFPEHPQPPTKPAPVRVEHPPAHDYTRGPLFNPRNLCRHHWWRAGPLRWVISLPFRRS